MGYSVPEIARMTKFPKTTVYNHIKNVKMPEDIFKEWKAKRGGSKIIKILKEKQALNSAKKLIKTLSNKERLLFMSALYWAEGNKKDFMLSNTDPYLIRFYVDSLRKIFGIKNEDLKISIRVYEDINTDDALKFWSKLINLPQDSFQNIYILHGKKQGKLKYGMCRVRVAKGGDYLKQVTAIYKTVANF